MLSLTPTKIKDYVACPQSYKLKHLDRRGSAAGSPALSFGMSMHSALEDLYKPTGLANRSFDLEVLLRRNWRGEGFADRAESESYFRRGVTALENYASTQAESAAHTLATEVYLSGVIDLGDTYVRLGCKADRIDELGDGVIEIIDYKTAASGRVPTAEWLQSDLATFAYYLLARIAYPEYDRVIVSQINVLTMAKASVGYDDQQLQLNREALVELVRDVEVKDFEPLACETCSWCAVREHCPLYGVEVSLDALLLPGQAHLNSP